MFFQGEYQETCGLVTVESSALGDITHQGFHVTLDRYAGMSPPKPCNMCIIFAS